MKHLLLITALLLTGCTSETKLGPCVGLLDDKNPDYVYEYDTGNIVVAMFLSETLIIPAIVVLKQLECPVTKREVTP